VLKSSGLPLGLFDDSHFVTSELPLAPQQLVILLTDGAAETTASEDVEFGTDGVLEYVRAHRQDSARDLAEGIYRAARAFAGDEPQRDDVTGSRRVIFGSCATWPCNGLSIEVAIGSGWPLGNLIAALRLYLCHYNFVRIHGKLRITPAMAAGVTDHLWSMEEMLNAGAQDQTEEAA
jgi:hypothetical protein